VPVKTIKPHPTLCALIQLAQQQFGEFAQTTGELGLRPLNLKAAERLRYARANNPPPALNVFNPLG